MHAAPAKIALLLALAAALGGCRQFNDPTISLVDARVVDQSPEGVAIDFVLEGANPNDEELPLQLVTYSLTIDGRRVFRGERMAEATLRRRGAQTFILPVAAPWGPIESADASTGSTHRYRLAGTLQYIAPGALAEVFFDTGVRRPTVRFAAEGELTLTPEPSDDATGR